MYLEKLWQPLKRRSKNVVFRIFRVFSAENLHLLHKNINYNFMNNYGKQLGPSLTFSIKKVMVCNFLWLKIKILVWSSVGLFLKYGIISGHLGFARFTLFLLYGIGFKENLLGNMWIDYCSFLNIVDAIFEAYFLHILMLGDNCNIKWKWKWTN